MATEDKLLNGSGLSHLSSKIKEYVDEHSGGGGFDPTDATNAMTDAGFNYGRASGTTVGAYSTALGFNVEASGLASTAFGQSSHAKGIRSFAEGVNTFAEAEDSHAEGYITKAASNTASAALGAHAEGAGTYAGDYYYIYALGSGAHAEGKNDDMPRKSISTAAGQVTHGAIGQGAHAEGYNAIANGTASHCEGYNTIAGPYAHVQGRYNVEDNNNVFADIVGNAWSKNTPGNAYALDWSGNLYVSGKIYQNCTDYSTNASGIVTPGCGGTEVGGGGGSSYTFTNGLTDVEGTVSWDLNDRLSYESGSTNVLTFTGNSVTARPTLAIKQGYQGTMATASASIELYPSEKTTEMPVTLEATQRGNEFKILTSNKSYRLTLDLNNKDDSNPLLTCTSSKSGTKVNLGSSSKQFGNGYFAGDILANNIPAPPSADGEYNLHCSIVGGVATYTWQTN